MKIMNLKTNKIFNLPKDEVKRLLEEAPDEFTKSTAKRKSKPLNKENVSSESVDDNDSILPLIIDN